MHLYKTQLSVKLCEHLIASSCMNRYISISYLRIDDYGTQSRLYRKLSATGIHCTQCAVAQASLTQELQDILVTIQMGFAVCSQLNCLKL